MFRSRNWHGLWVPALIGLSFTSPPALAQAPADPTDIGRLPSASQFPPESWQGTNPSRPANQKSLRGVKDVCPWCGARHSADTSEAQNDLGTEPPDAIELNVLANYLKELLTRSVAEERPATRHKLKTKEKLRPGEPAQVILELKERLGGSALEGTEFADSPDMLVKVIRALVAEQEQEEMENEPQPEAVEAPQPVSPGIVTDPRSEARIDALRSASSKLGEAADVLEGQECFKRADELRALADKLRRDARNAAAARQQADALETRLKEPRP